MFNTFVEINSHLIRLYQELGKVVVRDNNNGLITYEHPEFGVLATVRYAK